MSVRTQLPSVFDVDLPTIDYHNATHIEDAHIAIRRARQQGPIAIGPYGPEVLEYELVRTVLRDSRFAVPEGIALVVQGITSGPVWDRVTKLLISQNGADHQRLRRLVARAFTPRAAERLRTACVNVITELIDELGTERHCDLVTAICRPYPVPIICELLGAPREDWRQFSRWADDISKAFGCHVAEQAMEILDAWDQLETYVADLIRARHQSAGDDLISELLHAEDNGDRLSHDELVNLIVILLNAGTDTARNQLAAAIEVLCKFPDQWAELTSHPELTQPAVNELMRHSPIVCTALRQAQQDVVLGGVRFPAGTYVIANTASANRDPAVYPDPDRLDLGRTAPPILTFGGGAHYCLGAHLARVELAEALRVITTRYRGARCTGPTTWKPMTEISGPISLPIEFLAL